MKTTDMKVLMHSKGTLYVMNLNDDNFRFSRLFFPPWGGFFFFKSNEGCQLQGQEKECGWISRKETCSWKGTW